MGASEPHYERHTMKQQSPTEAQKRAVECLSDVQKCLSSFVRDLGGTDPQTAEVLVEIVAEKLADAGQELVQSFSGGLRQGEAAIGQASGGPQPLSAPLAQRPQSEQSIQPEEQPSDVAALLARIGAH
jgi:hypothetical protein